MLPRPFQGAERIDTQPERPGERACRQDTRAGGRHWEAEGEDQRAGGKVFRGRQADRRGDEGRGRERGDGGGGRFLPTQTGYQGFVQSQECVRSLDMLATYDLKFSIFYGKWSSFLIWIFSCLKIFLIKLPKDSILCQLFSSFSSQ